MTKYRTQLPQLNGGLFLTDGGIGNAGLPDTGATPDHMHYQATYKEVGMIIIYNYPFPDEGATIRAVVMMIKNRSR